MEQAAGAPETSTKRKPPILLDAFLAGFASTVGMMTAFAVYQNRHRIRDNAREFLLALGQGM